MDFNAKTQSGNVSPVCKKGDKEMVEIKEMILFLFPYLKYLHISLLTRS
jgi:hypothetical protein